MRSACALCVAATLLGCAASPPPPPAAPVSEEVVTTAVPERSDLVCTNTRTTGSQIVMKQCVAREESERIRQASQEWIRSGGSHGSPYYIRDSADPRDGEVSED